MVFNKASLLRPVYRFVVWGAFFKIQITGSEGLPSYYCTAKKILERTLITGQVKFALLKLTGHFFNFPDIRRIQ